MQSPVETSGKEEMTKIASELFSIIPGIERATRVPDKEAGQLKESDFIQEFVNKNRPCLVKGAIRHWPAIQKWRHEDYWIDNCRNEEKKILSHMNYYSSRRRFKDSETMHFHDGIRRLFANTDPIFSIPSQPVEETNLFGGVIKDLADFSFLSKKSPPLWDSSRALFIYRRAATAWHVHYCDETLMCQVKGAKEVVLLPPDMPETRYVTEFLEAEQYLKGQKLDQSLDLKPRIATVEEGDALYIPPYWFHCVVPKDGEVGFTSLTVFRSPWHIYGNLFNYFVKRTYKIAWENARGPYRRKILVWGCRAVLANLVRKMTGKK
jgi:hypothetical protein